MFERCLDFLRSSGTKHRPFHNIVSNYTWISTHITEALRIFSIDKNVIPYCSFSKCPLRCQPQCKKWSRTMGNDQKKRLAGTALIQCPAPYSRIQRNLSISRVKSLILAEYGSYIHVSSCFSFKINSNTFKTVLSTSIKTSSRKHLTVMYINKIRIQISDFQYYSIKYDKSRNLIFFERWFL